MEETAPEVWSATGQTKREDEKETANNFKDDSFWACLAFFFLHFILIVFFTQIQKNRSRKVNKQTNWQKINNNKKITEKLELAGLHWFYRVILRHIHFSNTVLSNVVVKCCSLLLTGQWRCSSGWVGRGYSQRSRNDFGPGSSWALDPNVVWEGNSTTMLRFPPEVKQHQGTWMGFQCCACLLCVRLFEVFCITREGWGFKRGLCYP